MSDLTDLRALTKRYYGDRGTTAFNDDTELDLVINEAYKEFSARLSIQNTGIGRKVTELNSVTTVLSSLPTLPSNFIREELIEIDPEGGDLSADETIETIELKPANPNVFFRYYREKDITGEPQYYTVLRENELCIFPPPGNAGSNSIRLFYLGSPDLLVGGGNEAVAGIPASNLEVISLLAAKRLRIFDDIDFGDLDGMIEKLQSLADLQIGMRQIHPDTKILAAGSENPISPFAFGKGS